MRDFTSDPVNPGKIGQKWKSLEVRTIVFGKSRGGQVQSGKIGEASGQKVPFQDQASCNMPHKMEHAGIAHGTTVGPSVPLSQVTSVKHPLLRYTKPGRPYFIRDVTLTITRGPA